MGTRYILERRRHLSGRLHEILDPFGRRPHQGAYSGWIEERSRLQAHLKSPCPNTRDQRFFAGNNAGPWAHRAIFVETSCHDIDAELERTRLVKNRWPNP